MSTQGFTFNSSWGWDGAPSIPSRILLGSQTPTCLSLVLTAAC